MVCKELRGALPATRTSRTQTQADAPVPADGTNYFKHLRHRTNLFLKLFQKKQKPPHLIEAVPTIRGAPNLEMRWRIRGAGALGLSEGHSDYGHLSGEGSSWLLSSSGRTLGKKPPSHPLSSQSVLPGSLREPSPLLMGSALLLGVQQGPWSRPSAGAVLPHCPDAQGEATGS